jgi:hypothetical protein
LVDEICHNANWDGELWNATNSGTSAGFGKYVMTRENGEVIEFPEAWWCGKGGGEAVALHRFTKLKFM